MKKSYLSIVAVLVFVAGIFFTVLDSNAHAEGDSKDNSSSTLRVSPVRTNNLVVAPGSTGKVTITLTNLTSHDMAVTPIENDFIASDEDGTPALILDANKYAPTHSLKRFMQPLDLFTVPAKSNKKVDLVIKVPKDAQAGGYYGALRFEPIATSTSTDTNANMQTSAASLVLLTVPGPMTEKLTVTNFEIHQNGKLSTNFRSSNDLSLYVRMKNDGNVHEGPFGAITVSRGDKVVYTYKFNDTEPRSMVLPDTARRWTIPLKNIDSWGKYKVSGVFTYGQDNQSINVDVSFWVVPWTLIGISAAAGIVLLALIVGIWLFLRSYKNKVLSNHQRRGGGYRR